MPSKASINSDDYYAVLGVDRNVSDAELAKAYKKLALKHHPDKNPDRKEQAEEEFKKISEAYDVLRCPVKRKEYDQHGKPSFGMGSQGNPQESDSSFFFGSNGGGPQRTTMSREEADRIFMNFFAGGSPFGDMFSSGGGPSGFRTARAGSGVFHDFGSQDFSSGDVFGGMDFGTAFPRTSTKKFPSATTSRARMAAGHRRDERERSRRAHSRPQSQSQRSLHHHVLAKGTAIVVQGLKKSPEHNGKHGHVVAWDASRGRYEVRMRLGDENMWVGDDSLWLRPQNITQLCIVEVTGLTTRPELNGMRGEIVNYCRSKRRYMVLMDGSGSTVSLQPTNCILSCDTCVLLDSLTDRAWNGQRARIISIDCSVGRYIVECESGTQLKVKYDNVLC